MPEIADDELLVKIEAIGLCFSDVKLIRAGESHPRVISKNLKEDPVIPGHEAVMSIVKVGSKIQDKFKIGQRYIIQADVYVKRRRIRLRLRSERRYGAVQRNQPESSEW